MAQQVGTGFGTPVGSERLLDRDLGELVLASHPLDRKDAAEVLRRVADVGEHGSWPEFPPEVVGRALMRLMTNWTPNPQAEMPLETSVVEVIGRFLAGFYDRPVR